jgi:DNA replication and repair protein RecF
VLVTGPNGVGKTNLLEALHFGSQGFSPRTRVEARLVRFGERAARVGLRGREGDVGVETEVTITEGQGKRILLNGAALAGADELRTRLLALVFTPDRLAVVKGGPIVRRTYLDRMIGRVFPLRAGLPFEYGRALAQRNAALRRAAGGLSSRAAVEPWTRQVARLGSELERTRAELVGLLAAGFAERAAELGLPAARLGYEERDLTFDELQARLERDLERGTTGIGPHLRDVSIGAHGRDLRTFGSQGEQRLGVLALLLSESALLAQLRGSAPLLLLDDVLSELDAKRRAALLGSLPEGQTVMTATDASKWPDSGSAPAAHVSVRREGDASVAEAI